jgi:hypothetical protein
MIAFSNWFKSKAVVQVERKLPERGRTRTTIIMDNIVPAELPNKALAVESKKVQTSLIQSILEMEKKAARLNTSLAELTLKNFNGGRS